MSITPSPGLLVLRGTIKVGSRRHHVRCLVDSGATHDFIDTAFVQRTGVDAVPLSRPRVIRMADKSPTLAASCCPTVELAIGSYRDNIPTFAADLGQQWDIILGRTWLNRCNPDIDWQNDIVRLWDGANHHTLRGRRQAADPTCARMCLTALQLKRCARKGCPVYLVVIKDATSAGTNAAADTPATAIDVSDVLEQFPDVLGGIPEAAPTPPSRAVDHHIALEPGASPPNRGVIRLSQPELEELRRQLEDLIAKGYIRPSVSPYGAPVLFAV
jgi:hypothetical protein